MRVSQERTLKGKLLQVAGAAERKLRAPNEMLQRVTDRRLAEADRRVLHGVCCWTRLVRNMMSWFCSLLGIKDILESLQS